MDKHFVKLLGSVGVYVASFTLLREALPLMDNTSVLLVVSGLVLAYICAVSK